MWQARWRFDGPVESATACNCTVCRRYGVLWIYGHEGEEIAVTGPTEVYRGAGEPRPSLGCGACGCVAPMACEWDCAAPDGRRRESP